MRFSQDKPQHLSLSTGTKGRVAKASAIRRSSLPGTWFWACGASKKFNRSRHPAGYPVRKEAISNSLASDYDALERLRRSRPAHPRVQFSFR